MYFFDLVGAAAGCLLVVALLNYLGGPSTVIAAAVLFAAAAVVWQAMGGSNAGRAVGVALTIGLLAFMIYNITSNLIDVRYAHHLRIRGRGFVKWNSFSRISVKRYANFSDIDIDLTTSTPIATPELADLKGTDWKDRMRPSSALPCMWRPGGKTLVIGPGGGLEIARCLAFGSRDITGVEINPIIATTIMREKYADLSQRLYLRPEVHIVVEDGRSFVRRTREKYQVLQLCLIGNWGSTNAGAYALTENSLYTVEAFRDYLTHLTDDGLLTVSRWSFNPPSETLQLISLAMEALTQIGEPAPWRHVIVAWERHSDFPTTPSLDGIDTLVISRKPFSDAELAHARATMAATNITPANLPGNAGTGPGFEFADLLRSSDPRDYQRNYVLDITPVTDNRPFFFYMVQRRNLWGNLTHPMSNLYRGGGGGKLAVAVPLLFGLMVISIVATGVILMLPPLVLGISLPHWKGSMTCLLYFICIGAGYILIEVALVQRFILFLGQPTYALTVVIFSMLVSSGLGSRFSQRMLRR